MRIKILLFAIFLLITSCARNDSSTNNYSFNTEDDFISSTDSSSSDYFSNLVISNVSVSKNENGWYRIKGEIKNNNNVRIMGYINVVLYDINGSIIDVVLIGIPNTKGLASGEEGSFAKDVSQTEFTSYKFEDATLMEP